MFDIGADEILLTTVVAIVAIGPKELPRALHLAGRWIGKFRRISGAFRSGLETMIREAEISEMEQNWATGRDSVIEHLAEQERLRDLSATANSSGAGRPELTDPESVTTKSD